MKKRLMLLIDDSKELEDIRLAFKGMEGLWETHYGNSATNALAWLAAQPADAIVATKQEQGDCGLSFLNQIARSSPNTLRFMIADSNDRELLLACNAQSHQYLIRPCPPSVLIRSLRRALTLDSVLANSRVKEFVSHSRALPALPSLYFSVLKHLESPTSTVQDVAREVVKDIAMTSKLLQLVNAAFLGLRQKVTSASDAISILGIETLKSLVLSIHVFDYYEKFSSTGFSPERLWSHSLAVANASRQLTLLETHDKRMADEAFTAGLLHDVGKLIFMANATVDYRRAIDEASRQGRDLSEVETEIFGAAHSQAGAYLVGIWAMPLVIQEAVGLHHSPELGFSKEFSPLTAVHVANALQHERQPDECIGKPAAIHLDYLKELGLDQKLDTWRHVLFGLARVAQNDSAPKPQAAPPRPAAPPVQASPSPVQTVPDAPPEPTRDAVPTPSEEPYAEVRWHLGTLIPSVTAVVAIVAILCTVVFSRPDPKAVRARHPKPQLFSDQENNPASGSNRKSAAPDAAKPSPRSDDSEASDETPGSVVVESNKTLASPRASKNDFPTIRLQGIFYRKKNPTAVINGESLGIGDSVSGARILSISPNAVVLSFRDQTRTYELK